jgi:hypothetical protein
VLAPLFAALLFPPWLLARLMLLSPPLLAASRNEQTFCMLFLICMK